MHHLLPAVDRVVCINLAKRKDRFRKARERFDAVGLDDVQFFFAEQNPRGAPYGCFHSHLTCIEEAYNDGVANLLIFEDDVQFTEGWEDVFRDAQQFLASDLSDDYEALFLGGHMFHLQEKTTPCIWRAKCIFMHAYVVSRKGMEAFLRKLPLIEEHIEQRHFDKAVNSIWKSIYCHKANHVIVQDGELGTDNYWIQGIPDKYVLWFQTVVVPNYFRLSQPLIRSELWRSSYLGRHYVWGIDDEVVDDGRVLLKGLWQMDAMFIALIMIFSCPPFGYLALLKDVTSMVAFAVNERRK